MFDLLVNVASLSSHQTTWVIVGLFFLGFIVLIMPFYLAWLHFRHNFQSTIENSSGEPQKISSFFQIPFVTWFLTHYGIAALALLVIVSLALYGILDKATVAALLGSLLGYILGSAASHAAAASQKPKGK